MKVAIIGGGMSGLVAAYAFQQYRDVSVTVYEPGEPGAAFLAGGLKYIHRTEETRKMLHDLGIVFTNASVRGGILLHGNVEPYPGVFAGMEPARAVRIREDHWRKTRKTEPGGFSLRAMNDPEASGSPRRALRCDLKEVVKRLVSRFHIRPIRVEKILEDSLVSDSIPFHFHYAVVTLPLWITRRLAPEFELPEANALKLNVVRVEPHRDRFTRWDYVYTPYTPENLVHRISPSGESYDVEFNGDWRPDDEAMAVRLGSELNFVFKAPWVVNDVRRGLNGHILPLVGKAEWPSNIRPLGRYAKWDPRATTDTTLHDAFALADGWGFERKRIDR